MLPPNYQKFSPQASGWRSTWFPPQDTKTVVATQTERVLKPDREQWCSLFIEERLGSGGAGDVFRIQRARKSNDLQTNRSLALKICRDETPMGIDRFKREFRSLRSLKHLPVAHSGRLARDAGLWGFTLRYCEGKNPLDHLRAGLHVGQTPALKSFYSLAQQLAVGLARMHEAGLTHGDIKPGNMIVAPNGRLWFLDFGLACRDSLSDQVVHPKGGAGTFQFLAPEVILRGHYGTPADVFAMARTLYLMFAGRLPSADFYSEMDAEQGPSRLGSHYFQRLQEQLPSSTPALIVNLLLEMLHPEPQHRPTASQVAERLGVRRNCEGIFAEQTGELWLDQIRVDARRAARGNLIVSRAVLPPAHVASAVKTALSGLFQQLPWFQVQEVDCRREQLPLRAFDATLSMLRFWAEQLPEPMRRELPLKNNPAIDLVGGDFTAIQKPHLVDSALELIRAASRSRLLVIPVRNLRYADPLSRQLFERLRRSTARHRVLILLTEDADDMPRSGEAVA